MGKKKKNDPYCIRCGRYGPTERHHLIHGSGRRQLAEEDGLVIELCHACHMYIHDNPMEDRRFQELGQEVWKQKFCGTDEDFRRRYGKSYV